MKRDLKKSIAEYGKKPSSKSNEGRHDMTIRIIESYRDEIRIKINEDTATVFYTTMENALRGIEEIKLRFPECAYYEIYEDQKEGRKNG